VRPLQVLRVAVRALLRNKMRSFLTTLGVIIGVSAVIATVAVRPDRRWSASERRGWRAGTRDRWQGNVAEPAAHPIL